MGASTKSEARDRFSHFFKESLSCISAEYVHAVQISPNRYSLTYEPSATLLCQAGNRTLDISQIFRIGVHSKNGGYKAITLKYDYTLNGEVDGVWKELVSYHWHPEGIAVSDRHLHVGCDCFPNVHYPTRRMSVERFIKMLFDYYGIEPELGETQWRHILEKNNHAFAAGAIWG